MASSTPVTTDQIAHLPRRFGIGTYRPISGGTIFAADFVSPSQSLVVAHPYSGTYGGTYGYILDTSIRPPQSTTGVPAPEMGLDNLGISIVRGFQTQTWTYGTLRPDYWYYFYNLWKLAGHCPTPFQYLVMLMYPDLSGNPNGSPLFTLARWDPPTHSTRDVGSFQGVTLTFTAIGLTNLANGTLISIL